MNREERDASNLAETYSGSSTRWSARANINGALTRTLSAQMRVSYTPARDVPQGRIGSRTMMHVGLRQRFLDGKGSINISVMDPFNLWSSEFETRDPTHVQIGRSEFSMRRATIGISWAFGRQPDSDRNRQMQEDEDVPEQILR